MATCGRGIKDLGQIDDKNAQNFTLKGGEKKRPEWKLQKVFDLVVFNKARCPPSPLVILIYLSTGVCSSETETLSHILKTNCRWRNHFSVPSPLRNPTHFGHSMGALKWRRFRSQLLRISWTREGATTRNTKIGLTFKKNKVPLAGIIKQFTAWLILPEMSSLNITARKQPHT